MSIFPNPVSSLATLEFELIKPTLVELSILTQAGQVIERIVHNGTTGINKIRWDAGSLPAGVYMCRVKACNRIVTRKMVKL